MKFNLEIQIKNLVWWFKFANSFSDPNIFPKFILSLGAYPIYKFYRKFIGLTPSSGKQVFVVLGQADLRKEASLFRDARRVNVAPYDSLMYHVACNKHD